MSKEKRRVPRAHPLFSFCHDFGFFQTLNSLRLRILLDFEFSQTSGTVRKTCLPYPKSALKYSTFKQKIYQQNNQVPVPAFPIYHGYYFPIILPVDFPVVFCTFRSCNRILYSQLSSPYQIQSPSLCLTLKTDHISFHLVPSSVYQPGTSSAFFYPRWRLTSSGLLRIHRL